MTDDFNSNDELWYSLERSGEAFSFDRVKAEAMAAAVELLSQPGPPPDIALELIAESAISKCAGRYFERTRVTGAFIPFDPAAVYKIERFDLKPWITSARLACAYGDITSYKEYLQRVLVDLPVLVSLEVGKKTNRISGFNIWRVS